MHHIHCLDTKAWLDNIEKVIAHVPIATTSTHNVHLSTWVHMGREIAVGLFGICS